MVIGGTESGTKVETLEVSCFNSDWEERKEIKSERFGHGATNMRD
jgi:hypothetical protein